MPRPRAKGASPGGPQQPAPEDEDAGFEAPELRGLFAAPPWLRELGTSAWLGVGIALLVVGLVWLLSLTETIVLPLIAAGVLAAVASPVVTALERRGVRRGVGGLLLVGVAVLVAAGLVVGILAGVTGEHDALAAQLTAATDTLTRWLKDLGVDQGAAEAARANASSAARKAIPQLLSGIGHGLSSLSSLLVFLSLTLLSLIFMLVDGPTIRAWTERHMLVPPAVAHQVNHRVLKSLQGYFVGVTLVAAFNAVVVLLGALLLGVPLAGTIAVVTFLGAFVPYLGAWAAGAFAVLVALGGAGAEAAIGMIVVQILANGLLQQAVQPLAYGAALGLHPLAVLVVTVAGGALFGAAGLILSAPLTSAAMRIAADLRRPAGAEAPQAAAPEPTDGAVIA